MAVIVDNSRAIAANVLRAKSLMPNIANPHDKISANIKYIAAVVRNLNASTELTSCKIARERREIADAAKAARARADAAALAADAAVKLAAAAKAEAEAAEAKV